MEMRQQMGSSRWGPSCTWQPYLTEQVLLHTHAHMRARLLVARQRRRVVPLL
jgi:hypothetical protein